MVRGAPDSAKGPDMRSRLLPFTLLAAAAAPLFLSPAPAAPVHAAAAPAPLSQLVAEVNIPYQSFTLPNGLRVFVHEDHKAPVVAVSVWYHVGSKDETAGKTGFAHL